jgi:hypothetical protein
MIHPSPSVNRSSDSHTQMTVLPSEYRVSTKSRRSTMRGVTLTSIKVNTYDAAAVNGLHPQSPRVASPVGTALLSQFIADHNELKTYR